MTKTLLFEERGITVELIKNELHLKTDAYWISDGETSFSTSERPELNYAHLQSLIAEVKREKEMDIAADVENDREDSGADFE